LRPAEVHTRRRHKVKESLMSEARQSFFLMALMAAILACYTGLGLLAVRVFG
jgi:hypothetical protein